MSKITKEEVCEYCHTNLHYNTNDNKYYCTNKICDRYLIPKFINQQPQLSEDVEEALMYVIDGLKCNAQWSIYEPFINTIKQHIQAQASELEQKEFELKVFEDKLNEYIEKTKYYREKVYAIREVCENEEELVIKKSENAYKNGRNIMRREIKQILDDELPFTDLPKDYSDGEVE